MGLCSRTAGLAEISRAFVLARAHDGRCIRARVAGWVALELVSCGVLLSRLPSRAPSLRLEPEPRRRSAADSAAASLIQSIEVTQPAPAQFTLLAAPGVRAVPSASDPDPPPECDAAPRELLRAGCPATPPATSACSDEGLECRYASGDGCAELHECVHGWWTHDNPVLLGQPIDASSALVRVSARGDVEWLRPLVTDLAITRRAADPAGNVTLAGAFSGSIDSGGGPLQSNGSLDVFVSSHGPDGKLRYSFALGGSGLEAVHGIAAAGTGRWRISFYLGLPVTLGDQLVAAGEHLLWVDEL